MQKQSAKSLWRFTLPWLVRRLPICLEGFAHKSLTCVAKFLGSFEGAQVWPNGLMALGLVTHTKVIDTLRTRKIVSLLYSSNSSQKITWIALTPNIARLEDNTSQTVGSYQDGPLKGSEWMVHLVYHLYWMILHPQEKGKVDISVRIAGSGK